MIKTNITIKSKTITFDSDSGEYSGLSFQYMQDESSAWVFIDWLNGGLSSAITVGNFTINDEEYDTQFLNRELTVNAEDYVKEKLLQSLNIHLNEFNYKYENTEEVGIPYLEKPTQDELDLFIKETILETTGVKEITSFESETVSKDAGARGKNKVSYTVEFKVKTETGEEIWQSIEI